MPTSKIKIFSKPVPTSYDNDTRMGYKHSTACTICNAKDRDGKPIRDLIDEYAIKSTSKQVIEYLATFGIQVSMKMVTNHIYQHAPYISNARAIGTTKIQKMIVRVHQEKTAVSDALQRIIDIGDTLVKEGNMPVSERLYIEALKEQGRRGVKTTLDTEFETMDDDFIKKIKEGSNVPVT
jgi:hypothetical protein